MIDETARWFGTPFMMHLQNEYPGLLTSESERLGKITVGTELGWGGAVNEEGVRVRPSGRARAADGHGFLAARSSRSPTTATDPAPGGHLAAALCGVCTLARLVRTGGSVRGERYERVTRSATSTTSIGSTNGRGPPGERRRARDLPGVDRHASSQASRSRWSGSTSHGRRERRRDPGRRRARVPRAAKPGRARSARCSRLPGTRCHGRSWRRRVAEYLKRAPAHAAQADGRDPGDGVGDPARHRAAAAADAVRRWSARARRLGPARFVVDAARVARRRPARRRAAGRTSPSPRTRSARSPPPSARRMRDLEVETLPGVCSATATSRSAPSARTSPAGATRCSPRRS